MVQQPTSSGICQKYIRKEVITLVLIGWYGMRSYIERRFIRAPRDPSRIPSIHRYLLTYFNDGDLAPSSLPLMRLIPLWLSIRVWILGSLPCTGICRIEGSYYATMAEWARIPPRRGLETGLGHVIGKVTRQWQVPPPNRLRHAARGISVYTLVSSILSILWNNLSKNALVCSTPVSKFPHSSN